jgi:hypothetical protein
VSPTPAIPAGVGAERGSEEAAVGVVQVEAMRVEVVAGLEAEPGSQLLVLVMRGVRKCGKEVLVAPHTAAVLGRAGVSPAHADRITHPRIGIEDRLDPDDVLPAVAEVVLVRQRLALGQAQVAQGGRRVVREHQFGFRLAVPVLAVREHVQMRVGPAHRRLPDRVQAAQRH